MALVVESGQTTGQIDLLSKLNTFIAGSGSSIWSVQSWGSVGAISGFPNDRQLSLKFGNTFAYVHFISQVDNARPRLYFAASTGYTGASTAWHAQSGNYTPEYQGISIPVTAASPPMNYWFFLDDNYLWIAVEISGGWFQFAHVSRSPARNSELQTGFGFRGVYVAGTIQWGQRTDSNHDYNATAGSGGTPAQGLYLMQGVETPMGIMGRKAGGEISTPSVGPARFRDTAGVWRRMGHYQGEASSADSVGAEGFRSFDQVAGSSALVWHTGTVPTNIPAAFVANLRSALKTCSLTVIHPTISGKYYPWGPIPGAFVTSTVGLGEAETIELDGDWYTVFPLARTRRVAHFYMNAGIAIKTLEP